MEPDLKTSSTRSHEPLADLLRACVHCGLCLEECPTYRLTGDENNSPRGRLYLWRAEHEGRIKPNPFTEFYTDECVGCLACVSVCPANVPYGTLLEERRREHYAAGRSAVGWVIRAAGAAVQHPALFNAILAPARVLRRFRMLPHPLVFPGRPATAQSTAAYTRKLMSRVRPTGPKVALFTGCLMEGLFREINFATVRVLIQNNVRVEVPADQSCCGALHEHTGLPGAESLRAKNRRAFAKLEVDAIVTNAAGCGLALSKALPGQPAVTDVLGFLAQLKLLAQPTRPPSHELYVDLPCHLVHGQRADIPAAVLDATGYRWQLAPRARDCCGSGGVYNLQKPSNAQAILRDKAKFLDELPAGIEPILTTANHVCMMQWSTARRFIQRRFEVKHVIQLLDPGHSHFT